MERDFIIRLSKALSIVTLYISEFWSFGRVEKILPNRVLRSSLNASFSRQILRIHEKNDSSGDYYL
jgi:hypothetical protein